MHQLIKCGAQISEFEGPAPFSTSHIIGREGKRTNNKTVRRDTKNNNNEATGYLGPMKIKLRNAAGLLKSKKEFHVPITKKVDIWIPFANFFIFAIKATFKEFHL